MFKKIKGQQTTIHFFNFLKVVYVINLLFFKVIEIIKEEIYNTDRNKCNHWSEHAVNKMENDKL